MGKCYGFIFSPIYRNRGGEVMPVGICGEPFNDNMDMTSVKCGFIERLRLFRLRRLSIFGAEVFVVKWRTQDGERVQFEVKITLTKHSS